MRGMAMVPEKPEGQRAPSIDDYRERWRKAYALSARRRDLFDEWLTSERAKGHEPSIAERIQERERIKMETEGS
jgi:hypothetical protein